MSLTDLFRRRKAAEATLEDPGILAAFAKARERAIEEFVTSAPGDQEKRDDAYQRLRALALVRRELEVAVADHKLAEQVDRKRSDTAK